MERLGDRGSGAEEHVKPATGHQGDEQRREAVNRREEAVRGEGPRVKEHIGKEAGQAKEAGRGGVCESVEDGRQERNGGTGKEQKKNGGLHPKGILGRLALSHYLSLSLSHSLTLSLTPSLSLTHSLNLYLSLFLSPP